MIIEGVNIPENKNILVGLTYIFGVGLSKSYNICKKTKCLLKKTRNLTKEERYKIIKELKKITIEGELKKQIYSNIRRLIDINSYRGNRHKKFLPVRGQRTRTNSKTRKKNKRYFFIKNEN